MTSSPDVIVIGAGVLGLSTAAELGARGHAVVVIDPGGPNASSVAAGMIAPALESLNEDATPERAVLLKSARDLWPDFAAAHGLPLHRDGAEWRGPDVAAAIARLRAFGFAAVDVEGRLHTPDDWRVDVGAALTRLGRAEGVAMVRGRVIRLENRERRWRVEAEGGRIWFAPSVVLATGAAPAVPGLSDAVTGMVDAIEPIRGQIVSVAASAPSRVLRAPGVYVAPVDGGVVVGATMERGRRDLDPDSEAAARLLAAARNLLGRVVAPGSVHVGVRGATADGLPMAGYSGDPGLYLALAPRRNGWLLGPLTARVVADAIEGRPPVAEAAALDPNRFA